MSGAERMGPDPREDPRWALVRAVADSTVRTPSGLTNRILNSVGGLRRSVHGEPMRLEQDGGTLQVGERAVVLFARRTAAEIATDIGGLHIAAVVHGYAGLDVLLTVHYGIPAADAAESLRSRLREALLDQFGPQSPPVNVHVDDIHA